MAGRIEIVNNKQLRKYLLAHEEKYKDKMRIDGNEPMELAAENNCNSISIIIAYELITFLSGVREVFTLEGKGKGLTLADGHEVLGVSLEDGFSYADGSIWQFAREEEHVRVGGPFGEILDMIGELQSYYGGSWRKKEIPLYFLTAKAQRAEQYLLDLKKERRRNAW